jgi:hypothetical protein
MHIGVGRLKVHLSGGRLGAGMQLMSVVIETSFYPRRPIDLAACVAEPDNRWGLPKRRVLHMSFVNATSEQCFPGSDGNLWPARLYIYQRNHKPRVA